VSPTQLSGSLLPPTAVRPTATTSSTCTRWSATTPSSSATPWGPWCVGDLLVFAIELMYDVDVRVDSFRFLPLVIMVYRRLARFIILYAGRWCLTSWAFVRRPPRPPPHSMPTQDPATRTRAHTRCLPMSSHAPTDARGAQAWCNHTRARTRTLTHTAGDEAATAGDEAAVARGPRERGRDVRQQRRHDHAHAVRGRQRAVTGRCDRQLPGSCPAATAALSL
jgi:hypothetical protein